jgi:hypothetical protein
MGDVFNFGLRGIDLNKVVGNAMQLPQAMSLAQQGRFDQAADIYSQITGMEHSDAVAAVKAMAAGHAVSLTPGRPGMMWQQSQTGQAGPSIELVAPSESGETLTTGAATGRRSCGLVIGIIAGVAVLIGALAAGGVLFFAKGGGPAAILPPAFASQTLAFGTEGIGQGLFEDPRSIGVDANGNITVADYQDGRVQTFDPTGKFLSGFSLASGNKKVYLGSMAVARDGKIYLSHDQKIFVYDTSGKKIGEYSNADSGFDSVTLGGDGKLYALSDSDTIVRLTSDGKVDLAIPDTFTKVTGDSDIDAHLAADGLGNMYIVGAFHYLVLKYTPQGDFVDQFGGEAKAGNVGEPGKFTSPLSIAVDGYGRIYVSDFDAIQVFDSSGTYVNQIPMASGVAFGMAFDDQNHLYVVTNQNKVMKYTIQAPPSN